MVKRIIIATIVLMVAFSEPVYASGLQGLFSYSYNINTSGIYKGENNEIADIQYLTYSINMEEAERRLLRLEEKQILVRTEKRDNKIHRVFDYSVVGSENERENKDRIGGVKYTFEIYRDYENMQELRFVRKRIKSLDNTIEVHKSKQIVRYATMEDKFYELGKQIPKIAAISSNEVSKTQQMTSGQGSYVWPVEGYTDITSPFGMRLHPVLGYVKMHTGMDIGVPSGVPIVACDAGTVVTAGWMGGYGNAVIVDHGNGLRTLYAHMSEVKSTVGQTVAQGQTVGLVGSTGYSTGAHLHIEFILNEDHKDPEDYLYGRVSAKPVEQEKEKPTEKDIYDFIN